MTLEKAPRWFLLLVCGVAIALCYMFGGRVVQTTDAEAKQNKEDIASATTTAWQAKNLSTENQKDIVDLKANVTDIRISQETFRKEYREDQKDLDRKLSELLKAVKA